MGLDFKKSQLKDLEKPDGTGAHNNGIGFNHIVGVRCNGQIIFNCHGNGRPEKAFLIELSKARRRARDPACSSTPQRPLGVAKLRRVTVKGIFAYFRAREIIRSWAFLHAKKAHGLLLPVFFFIEHNTALLT